MSTWIKASGCLPRFGVPVVAQCEDGSVLLLVRERIQGSADDGGWYSGWCQTYSAPDWSETKRRWTCDDAEYDDEYTVIRWHPLPRPPRVREPKEIKP
jgi:hypothetical protein